MMRPTFLLTYSPLRSRYPNLWKRGMEKGSRGDLMKTDMNQEDRREKDGTKNPSQVPISRGHSLLNVVRRIQENSLQKSTEPAELQMKIDREKHLENYDPKKLIDKEPTFSSQKLLKKRVEELKLKLKLMHKKRSIRQIKQRQIKQEPTLENLTSSLMLLKKKVEELCVQGFQVGGDPVAIHKDLLELNTKLRKLASFTRVNDIRGALFTVDMLLDFFNSKHKPLRVFQSEDKEEVAWLLIAEDLQEMMKSTNEIIHWLSVAYGSTVEKIIERTGTATHTSIEERSSDLIKAYDGYRAVQLSF